MLMPTPKSVLNWLLHTHLRGVARGNPASLAYFPFLPYFRHLLASS